MTIEIHEPELEAFIQQRMATGGFATGEEVLLRALCLPGTPPGMSRRKALLEVLEEARGLGDGVDFSRTPSLSRDVAF